VCPFLGPSVCLATFQYLPQYQDTVYDIQLKIYTHGHIYELSSEAVFDGIYIWSWVANKHVNATQY